MNDTSKVETIAPKKLTSRQQARRSKIMATVQAMIGEYGYDGTSMRAVAMRANVVEKTLYNIFGSKDALIASAVTSRAKEAFEIAAARLTDGGLEFLLHLASELARITLQQEKMSQALAFVLVEHGQDAGLNDLYDAYIGGVITQFKNDGQLSADSDPIKIVRSIEMMVISAILLWAKGGLLSAELEGYLRFQMLLMLMPSASDNLAGELRRLAALEAQSLSFQTPY